MDMIVAIKKCIHVMGNTVKVSVKHLAVNVNVTAIILVQIIKTVRTVFFVFELSF